MESQVHTVCIPCTLKEASIRSKLHGCNVASTARDESTFVVVGPTARIAVRMFIKARGDALDLASCRKLLAKVCQGDVDVEVSARAGFTCCCSVAADARHGLADTLGECSVVAKFFTSPSSLRSCSDVISPMWAAASIL